MDKALSIGRISASGSTILLIGQVVSTIILAIGIIVLGMFIQEGEYGVYAIALIPSSTILLFHDWGVSTALTRFSAKCRNTNKEGELHKIIKAGLIFEFLMGLILMMVSLLIANWVASTVLGKPNAAFFITLVSVTILSAPILLGAQSLFLGFDKIKFTGFTSIYQAIMQATLSILLVFSGYGTLGVILGYILSVTSSTVLAIILLYFGIIRKLPRNSSSELSISSALRQLLAFGFPLGINTIMSSFMAQFYFFMVALSVSEGIIGNYRMALNFVSFIAFITIPISNVLLPAFSKLDPKTEPHILKSVFKSSVKYTNVLLLPASMAVIVLSKPLVSTLYADKWLYASFFLSLAATVYLFESFGPISIRSLLTAVGETKFLMKIRILAIAIGIPLAFLIIPEFGIPGVVLVDILDTFPA